MANRSSMSGTRLRHTAIFKPTLPGEVRTPAGELAANLVAPRSGCQTRRARTDVYFFGERRFGGTAWRRGTERTRERHPEVPQLMRVPYPCGSRSPPSCLAG